MIKVTKTSKKIFSSYMPEPILDYIIRIYDMWNSRIILNKNMIRDLAEYFNLTSEEVVCMLKIGSDLNRIFWDTLNPTNDDEIEKFYQLNPFYAFSLSYWHMSRGQRNFRHSITSISGETVLDYGGGTGDLCIDLSKKNSGITSEIIYADIYGETFKFAKYLFEKYECSNITALDAKEDQERIWKKKYDTIICIDVIEHIPHPEVLLEKMARCLKKNGNLIITPISFEQVNEAHPMHFKMNLDAEKLLNSLGLYKSGLYSWLWVKNTDHKSTGFK